MKVFYNLTVLSSLARGADAWSWPWKSSSSTSIYSEGGDFNDGVYKGGEEAEKIWRDNGSDCGYIFSYGDDVGAFLDEHYVDIKGNWQSESYNRGVRAGANQVVKKYEEQCLENTAVECNDLGIAAAHEIAFEYCPFNAAVSFAPGDQPDYKQACREVAYGICQGVVGNQVNANGCSISANDLKTLQGKCEREVNKMTGGGGSSAVDDDHNNDYDKWQGSGDDGYEYIVNTLAPTDNPTKKPSKKPHHWGGGWHDDWHGSGDDEFAGIIRTDMPTEEPTSNPTGRPSRRPTRRPSSRPTKKPHHSWGGWNDDDWGAGTDDTAGIIRTSMPTEVPTLNPTPRPTPRPSNRPTSRPTNRPTVRPTNRPTPRPSNRPTSRPTNRPTARPTNRPTPHPSNRPTSRPTNRPTARPTNRPTSRPTNRPTARPTNRPSNRPSKKPTKKPHGWGGWNDDGYDYIETDVPTSFPTTAETEVSGSEFRAGFQKGEERAEDIWEANGSDCSYIFSFEDDVEKDLADNCSDDSSFCRGAAAGARKVVKYYEKKCLEDTASECKDLGEAAAQEIAFEYCPFTASASFAPEDVPDYKETCREVASGICKGAVGNQVNENGCTLSTSDLRDLQEKCEGQVNEMTGGGSSAVDDDHTDDEWHGSGDDEFAGIVRTDNPTSNPTFYPTEWDGDWKEPIPEPYARHSWKRKRGGKVKGHANDWK